MPFVEVSDASYVTVGRAFSCVFSITLLELAAYHFYTVRKSKVKARSVWATVVSLTVAVVIESMFLLSVFGPFDLSFYCRSMAMSLTGLYSLWKCSIYVTFTLKIMDSFRDSFFAHNNAMLLGLVTVFILWTVCNIGYGIWANQSSHVDGEHCALLANNLQVISIVMLDASAGIIYTYLFILPFRVMNSMAFDSKLIRGEFKRIVYKHFVLNSVVILSTLLAMMGFAVFSLPEVFISLDLNISSLCIMLSYSWNDKLMTKLCCCCIAPAQPSTILHLRPGTGSNTTGSNRSASHLTKTSNNTTSSMPNRSAS